MISDEFDIRFETSREYAGMALKVDKRIGSIQFDTIFYNKLLELVGMEPTHFTCFNLTPDEADELAARLVATAREAREAVG